MYWHEPIGPGYPGMNPGNPMPPGYSGGPMYPGYSGNPMYPGYPGYPGGGWHIDYDTIERRMWSYYPEIYHEAYPVVERVCNEMDDPWRHPIPSRAMVEDMVSEVSRRWRPSSDYTGEGEGAQEAETLEVEPQQRRLLRPLLTIILLSELLRRRRRVFRRPRFW